MKLIKNDSYTGRSIYLKTPSGPQSIWLTPKESVCVPESFISNTIRNLAKRRILKIRNA